jgi:O-antigen/teichoic acid export membrane protein
MKFSLKNILDFCLVLGGKASISAVIFLAGILLARSSGPAEFAKFSVAISLVLLCDGMIGAPLDMAAVRFTSLHPGETSRTERFEAMAMQLKLLIVLVVFVVALIARSFLPKTLSFTGQGFPLVVSLVAAFGLLAARSIGVALQVRRQFRIYSLIDAAQGVIRIAGFGGLALAHMAGAGAYMLVYGSAAFLAALSGITLLGQRYLLGRWPEKDDASRMLRYSGYSSGVIACGTATGRSDIVILALVNGSESVSSYGLASQMAMLIGQVALYSSVLTAPRLIPLARADGLRRLFFSNFLLVAVVALAAFVFLNPRFLEWGAGTLFGKRFTGNTLVLQILLAGAIVDLLIVPVLMSYCVQASPNHAFWGEIGIAVVFIASAFAAARGRLPWPPEVAMACVATSSRVAKLIFYGSLFAARTTPQAVAAL